MIKNFIFFLIALFYIKSSLNAQDTVMVQWGDTNYLVSSYIQDDKGKISDTSYYFKDNIPDAFYKLFHKNTILIQQGLVNEGSKQGQWAYWKVNGTLYMTETYLNGKLNGPKKKYWEDGMMQESLNYINDKQVGHQLKLKQSGKMWSKTILDKNGDGTYRFWDSKQSVVTSGNLKNWLKEGTRTIKSTINGQLVREDYWEKGKLTRRPYKPD